MKVLTLEGLAHFHAKLKSTIDNLGKQLPAIDETCITPTPTEDSNSFTLQADLCSTLKERMRTLDVLEIDFDEGWCEALVIASWSNDQGEGINLIGLDDKGMAWSWRINYTEGTCVRKKLATSEDVGSGTGGARVNAGSRMSGPSVPTTTRRRRVFSQSRSNRILNRYAFREPGTR